MLETGVSSYISTSKIQLKLKNRRRDDSYGPMAKRKLHMAYASID